MDIKGRVIGLIIDSFGISLTLCGIIPVKINSIDQTVGSDW